MAEIALGFGASHGSMLITQPEGWVGRAAADRCNSALSFRGDVYNFDPDHAPHDAVQIARARQLQHLADVDISLAREAMRQRGIK